MSTPSIPRREFARRLALSAAAAPLAGSLAGELPAAEKQKEKDTPQTEKPVPAERPVEPPPPEDLLLEVIKQQYPHERLDETVLNAIRNDLRGDLSRSRTLSSFPLHNWDEPAFVFAAYRADN